MFRNVYRVKIKGLNLDRLINYIMQSYKSYNLKRIAYDELEVELGYKSYNNLLLKIDTSCYNITVEKTFGIKFFLNKLKQSIALIISTSICLSFVCYLNTRLLKINIYGAKESTIQEIYKVLNQNNIKTFKSNKIELGNLEQDILQNVSEISLVSAVIKGNVLIINVKEKLPDVKIDYADFVAPYNLIIENIECYQGTLLKNKGDLVKAGETIIGAYTINANGEKTSVEPIYKLDATTYFSGQVEFNEIETKLERTGKKIVNSCYNIFNCDFLKINKSNKFALYEEETKEVKLFKNLFLPLTVKKQIYYELKEVKIEHNFEEEKELYLQKSKQCAMEKLPQGLVVSNTIQEVIDGGSTKLIQTYLEVKIKLTND